MRYNMTDVARTKISIDKLKKFKEELIEIYNDRRAQKFIVGEVYLMGRMAWCYGSGSAWTRDAGKGLYMPMVFLGMAGGCYWEFLLKNNIYAFHSSLDYVWKFKGTDIDDVMAWDILFYNDSMVL
jgi:hypothetical protein